MSAYIAGSVSMNHRSVVGCWKMRSKIAPKDLSWALFQIVGPNILKQNRS